MRSTSSLIANLKHDFPAYIFVSGEDFLWSPETKTITYIADSDDQASLLHELAHAILGHAAYNRDIELLELERSAWQYATDHLADTYTTVIPSNQVEDSLDTYRDWLHARSTCPACGATGLQIKKNEYKCIACHEKWRVNDARLCALRRYRLHNKTSTS
jgi:hypothetical protein